MSIQVTEIEIENTTNILSSTIDISKCGGNLVISDKYSEVTIPTELLDDLIKALNIFKCGY